MSVDLSQFIPSFLEESSEGLELMESSLLSLEPGDNETIHAIFRAAHSIKGGAGTFGFQRVTEFTHLVETLLDEMRDGRREIKPEDVDLLLESVDCIRLLIEADKEGESCDDEKIPATRAQLEQALGQESEQDKAPEQKSTHSEENTDAGKTGWQITFIPQHHLVQTGNDPLLLFNALSDLGELTVQANCNNLPPFSEMDPEELFLSWQLTLISESAEEDVREIFEWVEDECELVIEPFSTKGESAQSTSSSDDVIANSNTETSPKQITPTDSTIPSEPASVSPSTSNNLPDAPTAQVTKTKSEVSSIRVGVDKVDNLINLVGELVITQSMLSELGNGFDLSKVEKLSVGLEQLLQNTRELQESVMRIRMLPISFAFNRFPRLVHDLSKKTGKQVELQIHGENTELDKTVMEQIGDPLTHLVRNAVDHGIESADKRIAAGKPEQGLIKLDAYHQGGNIVIEISDDGAGINREAVLNKAIEKGIVEPNTQLNDSQVFDLIFEPGFSTAQQVSDISGRGVGMDVVKKNIQSLGGRIQIDSTPGQGSTFQVHLPLTLAILDGQLVKVGTETYVVPLISIIESLQPKSEHINRASGDMLVYRLREDNVPVLPIHQLFEIDADATDIEQALLVVVEADGQKVGLMVDDLLAQQQVVIKSLQDNYQGVEGISGATILGDGSVALILDIPGIIQKAMKFASSQQHFRRQARMNQGVPA